MADSIFESISLPKMRRTGGGYIIQDVLRVLIPHSLIGGYRRLPIQVRGLRPSLTLK